MKQVTLQFGSGVVAVKDVPPPLLRPGGVLVSVRRSLVSTGTERSKVVTARQGLLAKARSRPDQVRQVLKKLSNSGIAETVRTVRNRLTRDEPLGYSCVGDVVVVGSDVPAIRPGDRVACAGAGYANHAELVWIPKNLCARVPDGVSDDAAAFVTVGAIALHGARQADLQIGERVLVIGLGLLGQLTVQIVNAAGGVAFGSDLHAAFCERALENGAVGAAMPGPGLDAVMETATGGRGFDAAIITASDSGGHAFELAIDALRDRGRVVIVGAVGISIQNSIKSALYEREIDVRVARSYGPGRYDEVYEERGSDYPFGYVRWTEQRNLEAVIDLMARDRLRPERLVTHRFDIAQADRALDVLAAPLGAAPLAVLLEYSRSSADRMAPPPPAAAPVAARRRVEGRVTLGVIGAGNFAQANLLPHLVRRPDVDLGGIATASGLSAAGVAAKFGFARAVGDVDELLKDERIHAVLIATRHDSHADLVCRALEAGKHVFVEKPLARSWDELARVASALSLASGSLMVGFNRRFAPLTTGVREALAPGPWTILYRVHAGPMARDSWYRSPHQGGGRFIGEGGHFLDLITHITGSSIGTVSAAEQRGLEATPRSQDNLVLLLQMTDGSAGSLAYLSGGGQRLPKERIEIFGGGRTIVVDNFRSADVYAEGARRRLRGGGKGHREEMLAWIAQLRGGEPAVRADRLLHSTAATLAAIDAVTCGLPVTIPGQYGGA